METIRQRGSLIILTKSLVFENTFWMNRKILKREFPQSFQKIIGAFPINLEINIFQKSD